MTEYAVSVDVEAAVPLPLASGPGEVLAEWLAQLGGAASYAEDGSRVDVTMTVDATDPAAAGEQAIERVLALVSGEVVSLEVLTTEEQDRRLAEPPSPPLGGGLSTSVGSEPLVVTFREAAAAMRCSVDTIERLADAGHLRAVRVRRVRRITMASLRELAQ